MTHDDTDDATDGDLPGPAGDAEHGAVADGRAEVFKP